MEILGGNTGDDAETETRARVKKKRRRMRMKRRGIVYSHKYQPKKIAMCVLFFRVQRSDSLTS